MTQATRRLLTSGEVCKQLGIGSTKLYKLIAADELIPVRLPSDRGIRRELRFEQADIDAFIARNKQPA